MRAITVRQPWAYAIAQLGKNVENRSWSVSYRGILAIHAGAGWAGDDAQSSVAFTAQCGYGDVEPARRQRSAVMAVADLVDVCGWGLDGRGCDCGHWAISRQYHWRLANIRPLHDPVPCTGRLSLWELPAEVETAVRMRIAPPVQDMRYCRWCRSTLPADHVCPAGAVGCTNRPPDDTPCGCCPACIAAMTAHLSRAEYEHGSPSDLYNP